MADEKPFMITLKVAGKSYPMSPKRDKEELYRVAERMVNSMVNRVAQLNFENFTERDYLAMAALQLAVSNAEMNTSREVGGSDLQQLEALSREIDDCLNAID